MERDEAARRRRAEIAAELMSLADQVSGELAERTRALAESINSWDV